MVILIATVLTAVTRAFRGVFELIAKFVQMAMTLAAFMLLMMIMIVLVVAVLVHH